MGKAYSEELDEMLSAEATRHDGETAPDSRILLTRLMNASLILADDWEKLPPVAQDELKKCSSSNLLLPLLVKNGLLTEYQANVVDAGRIHGLVLGNYRVLDRLGAGGMGVVFKGEHLRMRRLVAIKVLRSSPSLDSQLYQRFLGEMRAVAQLDHPNIVSAIDDGEMSGSLHASPLYYFVMEYVPGQDLEEIIRTHGPMSTDKACGLIYQVASALTEAHRHSLVHRDIKPSNIRVTPDGRAKLLDFGLVRQLESRLTNPGTVLGSVDFVAPEQVRDASNADIRADIYGLGGTLCWCLTGKTPFSTDGSIHEKLVQRLTQLPPSVHGQKPEVSAELDAVIARMMACRPEDRFPTPQAVMDVLLRFLKTDSQENLCLASRSENAGPAMASKDPQNSPRLSRVLVVDDSPTLREFCSLCLQEVGLACDQAPNAVQAIAALETKAYDLVLTDWNMPGMTGLDLCLRLRANPPSPNLKIILFSAEVTDDDVAKVLDAGADDYLTKQFSPVQLVSRVKAALRLKDSQDRADLLNRQLLTCNQQMEQNLSARDVDLVKIRNALVLSLADLVSSRDVESLTHVMRLQEYCRCLAEEASHLSCFAGQIDRNFIEMLVCCSPLHDIGKAGLPDHVLLNSNDLSVEEKLMMQTHTTLGAETLQKVAERHGSAVAFLQMAIDIARSHHERYDGKGYPDRLTGNAIPLAARIVSIADAYDGLRSRRAYKPALAHSAALQVMLEGSSGQFDPLLLQAFESCAGRIEQLPRN